MNTGIPRFFWERRIAQTVSTFVTGRAMFLRVTARRACREAKSRTQFFRVSKRRPIWRELLAHLLLTRIWPLFSEVAPVFRRLVQSAGYSCLLLNASSGAAVIVGANRDRPAECACLSKGLSLKRPHASRNLKASLVGSSFTGCRCNYLRSNRVHSSGYGCRDTCAVLWSLGVD